MLSRCQSVRKPGDDITKSPYVQAGIETKIRLGGVIEAIFLYSEGHHGYVGFRGTLHRQVTFTHTRQMMWADLGEPKTSREQDGSYGAWDRWAMPGYLFHVNYSSANEKIEMITLMPLDGAPPMR